VPSSLPSREQYLLDNLNIIIPFFNGEEQIDRLIDSIPNGTAPILIVDDLSDEPYKLNRNGIKVVRLKKKGYFTGAVNYGLSHTTTDVLILNQDALFSSAAWIDFIEGYRNNYALMGERIKGIHPVWSGYIQGTFMFIRRDVIDKVGLMNEKDYPLWGSTCEYQARVCRENMPILMVEEVPGFIHQREGRFGAAITTLLKRDPMRKAKYIKTPPEVSVIIPCYNYGKYLPSAVNSLIGGKTDLGEVPQQTFASFEVVIVDDGSTDNSDMIIRKLINPQKGVRSVHRNKTEGTAAAINTGIENSFGRYITILGADDMRKPDALEKLYRAQLKNLHSFIYDEVEAFGDGKLKPELHFGVSPYNFERLLFKNHIHAGIMFPKRAWEEVSGYPEVFSDGREDWAMNVTLGIHGYCGILLEGYKGYLYRREGHNRSSRNGNQRAIFLGKLKLLYPEIYAGDRPEMCCGDKRKVINPKSKSTHRKGVVLMNTETSVLLEYIGDNYGKASFYGLSTGNQYRAGKSHKIVPVDKRDLTGSVAKPGLLDLKEKGKPIFRLYQLPKKVEPVKASVKKAAPKKLATAKIEVERHVITDEEAAADLAGLPRPVEKKALVKKALTKKATAKK
jgi:glycosyltransferase involved in cell wall biosynthesis